MPFVLGFALVTAIIAPALKGYFKFRTWLVTTIVASACGGAAATAALIAYQVTLANM